MEVKINQVILHLLDPGASEPLLSDRPMDLDADLFEYFTAVIEKAFASDEVKNCRFLPDSAFAQEMAQNQDFVDLSRRIAGVIFEQMLQYPAIPAGDLAVVDFAGDGVPFYGVLKLNYRPGYTHHTETLGNGRFSSMVPQRTLLPGTPKADEAALIDRANGTVRLIEKKFNLDEKKDFYLSTRVFGCTEAMQEKAKLKAVCETAVAAVKEAYPEPEELDDVPPFDGGTETAVELMVRNQAVDNTISVEDVRTRMREKLSPGGAQVRGSPGGDRRAGKRPGDGEPRPDEKAGKPQLQDGVRHRDQDPGGALQFRRCGGVHPLGYRRAESADQGRTGMMLRRPPAPGGRFDIWKGTVPWNGKTAAPAAGGPTRTIPATSTTMTRSGACRCTTTGCSLKC